MKSLTVFQKLVRDVDNESSLLRKIGYTDSYDPLCTSEFYFEGDYRQDDDGNIVFVAISQKIYVFCESYSLELDWSRV